MQGETGDWPRYRSQIEQEIHHKAEGPLLDKKREHYYFDVVQDGDGNLVDPKKERNDLLKDLIALSNAARQRNEQALLCLGIAEYDDWTIWGVEGRHPKQNPKPTWAEVEAHQDLINRWAESISRTYLDFAKQFIEPGLPTIHYETGWCQGHLNGDAPVENVPEFLDRFAHSRELPRVLMVTGAPGSGKTTLLRRLAWNLASEANQAMIQSRHRPYVRGQDRWLDYPKDTPVPVLVKLWGFELNRQCTPESIFRQAMTRLAADTLNLDRHSSPAEILKDRDLSFVVMLDGLDEIPRRERRQWERTLGALYNFVERYPHARFIITCRSTHLSDAGPQWNDYPNLHIELMTPQQTLQYLGGTRWQTLLDHPEVANSTIQLLCNPRRANALRETEMISQSLGIVLNSAVSGFLTEEHQKYHSSPVEQSQRENKASTLATELFKQGQREIGEEAARRQLTKRVFDWLYRAGLLIIKDRRVRFADPLLHDYFVAKEIIECWQDSSQSQQRLISQIDRYPELWRRAIRIAANIWPNDLTIEPAVSVVSKLDIVDRLQVLVERQYEAATNLDWVKQNIGAYLQQPDADLALVDRLVNDSNSGVQRVAIECVGETRYEDAMDILVQFANQCDSRELRHLAAKTLVSLGDSRGDEFLQHEEGETSEELVIPQKDRDIGSNELGSHVLDRIIGG